MRTTVYLQHSVMEEDFLDDIQAELQRLSFDPMYQVAPGSHNHVQCWIGTFDVLTPEDYDALQGVFQIDPDTLVDRESFAVVITPEDEEHSTVIVVSEETGILTLNEPEPEDGDGEPEKHGWDFVVHPAVLLGLVSALLMALIVSTNGMMGWLLGLTTNQPLDFFLGTIVGNGVILVLVILYILVKNRRDRQPKERLEKLP